MSELSDGRFMLDKIKDDAREIAELKTSIEQIEEGRRMDVASWRQHLARARTTIAE